MKQKVVVITGAGVSAESGISTFRDAGGLWEGHDVMQVASPQGWQADMELVLDFYNARRRQLLEVEPNDAHKAIANLEEKYDVVVVTQNVDNLHERAGSTAIIHLHGRLDQVRSTIDPSLITDTLGDIHVGDLCAKGSQLRPHIVWFGEEVPMIEVALEHVLTANIIIICGTSMAVYPAAGLVGYAPKDCKVYYIDPNPATSYELSQLNSLTVIAKSATAGFKDLQLS